MPGELEVGEVQYVSVPVVEIPESKSLKTGLALFRASVCEATSVRPCIALPVRDADAQGAPVSSSNDRST
jgi:hypothetical protein